MVIGNGQIAKIFENLKLNDVVIFASGVADSNTIESDKFKREEMLLTSTLLNQVDKKFVYFSSCALSAENYPKNEYYRHKFHMEDIIKNHTDNYYIFRIPQLFGCLKTHKTLINFLYNSVVNDEFFNLYSNAYRYVIEINDVRLLVEEYLKFSEPGIIVNLANNYRYSVIEIVEIFENLLNKKAKYKFFEKTDEYYLELDDLNSFIKKHNININFSHSYLREKLELRISIA